MNRKMQLRAVIIDDEKHSLESTDILIRRVCPCITIAGQANTPEQGIVIIESLKPDLVFLDIAMPRMNGFELLQSVTFRDFEVIFTTAFNDFAIKAFKVNAIDYLLKPIEPEELVKAVEKVKVKLEKNLHMQRLDEIIHRLGSGGMKRSKLALPVEGRIAMIEFDSVIYCESDGNYTRLHLDGDKKIMVSRTLKDIERMLPHPLFVRIHHSHLVNINHVTDYIRGEGGEVLLSNGIQLRVSRNRKDTLLDSLFQNPAGQ
ncbi:MAG: response regulator transcription factor [Bacteroidales bacterium]|nr:response regulator transcription factor [Bacteroidales bacterium]